MIPFKKYALIFLLRSSDCELYDNFRSENQPSLTLCTTPRSPVYPRDNINCKICTRAQTRKKKEQIQIDVEFTVSSRIPLLCGKSMPYGAVGLGVGGAFVVLTVFRVTHSTLLSKASRASTNTSTTTVLRIDL